MEWNGAEVESERRAVWVELGKRGGSWEEKQCDVIEWKTISAFWRQGHWHPNWQAKSSNFKLKFSYCYTDQTAQHCNAATTPGRDAAAVWLLLCVMILRIPLCDFADVNTQTHTHKHVHTYTHSGRETVSAACDISITDDHFESIEKLRDETLIYLEIILPRNIEYA